MALVGTLRVLELLRDRVAALQWRPEGGIDEPAFERVELYDLVDLEQALAELRIFKGRVCVIVAGTESWVNEGGPTKLLSRWRREVALLIADRDFGQRRRALVGSDGSPGVLGLKELVLDGVVGELGAGSERVVVQPVMGLVVALAGEKREVLSGRQCFELDLEILGGLRQVRLGSGPV